MFPTYPPSVLGRGWSLLASAAPMLSDSEELVQDPGSGALATPAGPTPNQGRPLGCCPLSFPAALPHPLFH